MRIDIRITTYSTSPQHALKKGGGGGSLHEMQEMEVMMSGLLMLTVVAAAVVALGAATWLIVGLCRAADVGDVDEGRAFGGEFEE